MLGLEEEFWRVQSRSNWLKHGDRNTAYFYYHASQRRKQNTITGLEDANGCFLTKEKDIQGLVVQYFSELFSSTQGSIDLDNMLPNGLARKLTEEQLDMLDQPFMERKLFRH